MKAPTYQDVDVFINDAKLNLFEAAHGYSLTCSRVNGWELWRRVDGAVIPIAGEYGELPFRVEVRGMVICDNTGEHVNDE
jgi:hypothetical protein